MMTESFEERLEWLEPNYYEKKDKDDTFIIKENVQLDTEKSVPAEIHFKVSGKALKFIPEIKGISFLKAREVGEAIIFVVNGNEVDIHIIECKTTVGFKTWRTIKNKFKGSWIYSLPFVGILELSIRSINFYTAYYNDDKMKVKPSESPLSSIFKIDFISEWKGNKIQIGSKSVYHQKIHLELDKNDKIEVKITL